MDFKSNEMMEITATITKLVKRHIDEEQLKNVEIDSTMPLADIGVDSLEMVALIVALENEFSIEYPADLIQANQFENIKIIAKNIVDLKQRRDL
ncbi:MAG: hypothetical protein GQ574_04200 [Crocinitomix sp.]|nr:hypothetical protein [Crocinitomix sp.]